MQVGKKVRGAMCNIVCVSLQLATAEIAHDALHADSGDVCAQCEEWLAMHEECEEQTAEHAEQLAETFVWAHSTACASLYPGASFQVREFCLAFRLIDNHTPASASTHSKSPVNSAD